MKNTLVLDNPILINGKTVEMLTYDPNEITALQFADADAHRMLSTSSRNGKGSSGFSNATELDYTFHLYLGIMAVVAVNPEYDVSDLERAKGDDVRQLMGIGRNFMLGRAGVSASADEISGAASETTPAHTTSRPQSSKTSD